MQTVLVTGGAGYIGSILVPELLSKGFKVIVYDNFMYRQFSLGHICHHPNLTLTKGDIRVKSDLLPYLKKSDIIIPLAAYVGAPICKKDPVGAESTNKTSTIDMFHELSPSQILIMPTTNSAYGSGDANNYCDENSPLNPISDYAKHKVIVEKELLQRENSISFRLATVFGISPRMRIDLLVNDFTWRAYSDRFVILFEAHFKRNYIHVRDVVRAFLHGIDHFEQMKGQIYNVGLSSANISKMDLCIEIKKQIPDFTFIEAQVGEDPDKRNYIVSNDKIEKTGFIPNYDLKFGINELIKGYQMIQGTVYGNN
jgi:nucleoside-diphosphate-sugar epimerase